jgi:hypothetical protein
VSDENVVQRLLRERREQEAGAKAATGCLKAVGILLSWTALIWWRPFVLMLALGILHDRYEIVPALGFWSTWVLLMAANFLTGRFDLKTLAGKKTEK